MRPRLTLTCGAIAGVLACAPPASAKLPDFPSNRIDPGRSLGGLKLGKTMAQAKRLWGKPKECSDVRCVYDDGTDPVYPGSVSFTVTRNRVDTIEIIARKREGADVFDGPLVRLRTTRGIHLGSSGRALEKAHPKVRDFGRFYELGGPGRRRTAFSPFEDRIYSITVDRYRSR